MTTDTAKELLQDMVGKTYLVNGKEEVVEHYHINDQLDTVTITTDKTNRRHDLHELAEDLKMYRKPQQENTPVLQAMDLNSIQLPANKNLEILSTMLMEAMADLSKNPENIKVVQTKVNVANSMINIEKTKIDQAKVIISAHQKLK